MSAHEVFGHANTRVDRDYKAGINVSKCASISSAVFLVASPATTPLISVSPCKPNISGFRTAFRPVVYHSVSLSVGQEK